MTAEESNITLMFDQLPLSTFIQMVYGNILKKMGKAAALREAGVWLLRSERNGRYAHPAYWAPFYLVGDWQ